MILTQTALVLIGLLVAAWTLAAGWAIISARTKERRLEAAPGTTKAIQPRRETNV